MKIYKLVEKETNTPVSVFIKDEKYSNNNAFLLGVILDVVSTKDDNEICELSFVANGYIKFDGCSHFNFYGQDFKNKETTNPDSYYHLCGFDSMRGFIRNISFMWELAIQNIDELIIELGEANEFIDFRDSSQVLYDYKIIEENIDENNKLYKLLSEYLGGK